MKNKKETKIKEVDNSISGGAQDMVQIATKADLRTFITDVRDRLLKDQAAPIFAMSAMQQVMSLDSIYDLMDKDNKEILQEIWVKLHQSGLPLEEATASFWRGRGVGLSPLTNEEKRRLRSPFLLEMSPGFVGAVIPMAATVPRG